MEVVGVNGVIAVLAAAMLAGCTLLPRPDLACEGVPAAVCEAAYEEAVSHGLFLNDTEEVVHAVVRPTRASTCNQGDEPILDVSFDIKGRSEPVTVTIAQSRVGRPVVCTY
jgi:hypothetical protein